MNNWNADLMFFFFFNDTATTEIYTLSLHDALPIWDGAWTRALPTVSDGMTAFQFTFASNRSAIAIATAGDRKSTRLNSSHSQISYAVFCLKKKKNHDFCLILSSALVHGLCCSTRSH